jgi:hypothetical protein
MRVTLDEEDIKTAVEDYILNTVKVPDNVRIDIDLKATRGPEGHTAEIDLVHMDLPVGDPDPATADQIEAPDEAREEGLGIVEKIDAAKASAKAPRRRGRPPGSKNKPKVEAAPEVTPVAETQVVEEPTQELAPDAPETPTEAVQAEVADEAPEVVETPVAAPTDEPEQTEVEEPAPAQEAAPARSLFGGLSETTTDDGPATTEAEATDTGTPVEEPVEEEVEDVPVTPETPGLTTEDAAGDDAPAPTPTRSLFADLTKPTN